MCKKIGSPSTPCNSKALPGEGKPVDQAKHQGCSIRIISIKEKDNEKGDEYKQSGAEICVKSLSEVLVIKYEVKACSMSVSLWIEFDPANKVHADFYKTYEGKGVLSPKVVTIVTGEIKNPGIYEVLWDGRDKTSDHRILLSGTYKVRVQGLHEVLRKDETTIKIMPPFSCNYGIHYPSNTTKKEIDHATTVQKKLKDGTAFIPDSSVAITAFEAWTGMKDAAVNVVSGHSNPFLLAFYPEESKPGKPVHYTRKKTSYLLTIDRPNPPPAKPKADIDNSVFIPEEPANALRDVFLSILAGCRASNEIMLIQQRLKELSVSFHPKGIDGKHGPKTTKALAAWQKWENVTPADGTKNEATLNKLAVDKLLDEKKQTREVQKKLTNFSKSYDPGKVDGVWGDHTEDAITNYQEDHSPPLEINSLPDNKTLKHLHPAGTLEGKVHDIAEAFTLLGCNLVLGFIKKVSFSSAEKWHIHFWNQLAAGSGVNDAAAEARELCGSRRSKELEYLLYSRSGVDNNSTLHPARHGKDMV